MVDGGYEPKRLDNDIKPSFKVSEEVRINHEK